MSQHHLNKPHHSTALKTCVPFAIKAEAFKAEYEKEKDVLNIISGGLGSGIKNRHRHQTEFTVKLTVDILCISNPIKHSAQG